MNTVTAAVQLDNVSTDYKVKLTMREAREFCDKRDVIYTYDLEKLLHFIDVVMGDKYYLLYLGREGSRVLYVEWSTDMTKVPLNAFDSMRSVADEFKVSFSDDWATLRVWWD